MKPESLVVACLCVVLAQAPRASHSVLEHHGGLNRSGHYVEPSFTPERVRTLALDSTAFAEVDGDIYAHPLFLEGGWQGRDVLVVVTETNHVYALDALSGQAAWDLRLGPSVSRDHLPCGNISPLGVTGTPVVDANAGTLYLDAMETPDQGRTKKHKVYAISLEDHQVKKGWPLDIQVALPAGTGFKSEFQNQRGALAIIGNRVYIPFGGHFGDCGDYRGRVVGVSLDSVSQGNTRPGTGPVVWSTGAPEGGIWAPGGVSSDGKSIFVTTGNTAQTATWKGGEAIVRLNPDLSFSGNAADYFAPSNWKELDDSDADLGGTGAIPVDVPGASPSELMIAFGKDGNAYLASRTHLGGIGGALGTLRVAGGVITAPAAYTMPRSTYVVIQGSSAGGCPGGTEGDLVAVNISSGSPPRLSVAWCAHQFGRGSPIVTTTDERSNPIVWGLGAEGDERLRGFDGETGQVIYDGARAQMAEIERFQSPIVAKGRMYVASKRRLYSLSIH